MTDVIAGRFALCDPIARGGTGVVWRAYDRKTQKFCAAKVLRRRDAGDLLRFVREQSYRISDDHVLTPYSWAAEDTHVVIASDLVDGGSMSNLLTEAGALSEPTVAVMLDQLLGALASVHAAGLIHRDVKPANLLLRATGTGPIHLLLSDFGLAMGEQDARLTQVGMIVGTPGYVAPELLTGTAEVDPRQDLYAAGRGAAAGLIGTEPGASTAPDLGAVCDPRLRELIERLTAVNPATRPHTAAEARQWLRAHVPGDARPRTRAGRQVQVRSQLGPLPEVGDLTGTGETAWVPVSAAASGRVETESGQVRVVGARPIGDTPSVTPVPARPPAPRSRRRTLLIGAAAAAVIAAAVTATVLATGSDSPASSGVASGHVVIAGSACGWPDQNEKATTRSGAQVTCTLQGHQYLWR